MNYRDKLDSINFGTPRKPAVGRDGAAKVVEVVREDDGTSAGFHRHHGDGRVDAVVTPQTVQLHATTEGA